MDKLALREAWNNFISTFGSSVSGVLNLMMWVGVLLLIVGFYKVLKNRRAGGGLRDSVPFLLTGSLFAAPKALIPFLLLVLDFTGNIVLTVLTTAFGG